MTTPQDYVPHSDYAALEAECERLRVDAGELVVAQYATSAAIARAEALEARLAEVEKALKLAKTAISDASEELYFIRTKDPAAVRNNLLWSETLPIALWAIDAALARGGKADSQEPPVREGKDD